MSETNPEKRIYAVFEFSRTGYLRAIFLEADNDRDQAILERALDRLLRPGEFGWIKRLFKR